MMILFIRWKKAIQTFLCEKANGEMNFMSYMKSDVYTCHKMSSITLKRWNEDKRRRGDIHYQNLKKKMYEIHSTMQKSWAIPNLFLLIQVNCK